MRGFSGICGGWPEVGEVAVIVCFFSAGGFGWWDRNPSAGARFFYAHHGATLSIPFGILSYPGMRQRCAKRSGASWRRVAGVPHFRFECVSVGGCLAWSELWLCFSVRGLWPLTF